MANSIGPWFKFILRDLFFYISTLDNCLSTYEISGTAGYDFNEPLCASDTKGTVEFFNDNSKLNILYLRILNQLKNKNFPIDLIQLEKKIHFKILTQKLTALKITRFIKIYRN